MPLIKCKFCNWTHQKKYRKNGKLIDGQNVLRTHVELCHEDQYMEIVSALEQEMMEKENGILQNMP